MHVKVFPNKKDMAAAAANLAAGWLRDAIRLNGKAIFVAATGASQFDFLEALTALPDINWEHTCMFHLDEYIGLPEAHPASFRGYLRQRIIDRVHPGDVNLIQGDATDIQAELKRLNRLLAANPVDVAFVGIGENGHLAFNDPPADFTTTDAYILVNLDDACRRQQLGEGWFKTIDEVPRQAISMSIRQIIKSTAIVCTVPDLRKAQAVKDCFTGEITPLHPASILRSHPDCTVFLDKDAASLLPISVISNLLGR